MATGKQQNKKGSDVPEYISLKLSTELKMLVEDASVADNVGLGEFVVRVLADHFERPDLAFVPRKRPGKKPERIAKQEQLAANGK